MLGDDLEGYRRHMKGVQDLSRGPYYETITGMAELDKRLKQKHGFLTGFLSTGLMRLSGGAARGEAVHRLSRLGLAATAYRLKYGKLPATLEALVPEYLPRVPLDPFDGKSMRMAMDGGDMLIYSIGIDLKDNGGKAPDKQEEREADIVFRLKGARKH